MVSNISGEHSNAFCHQHAAGQPSKHLLQQGPADNLTWRPMVCKEDKDPIVGP